MLKELMNTKTTLHLLFLAVLVLALSSCGATSTTQPPHPLVNTPAHPVATATHVLAKPQLTQTSPAVTATSAPVQPAPTAVKKSESGGGGGGEAGGGGGGEASTGLTLTNPGGLPSAPASSANDNSQSGQERMVKAIDPAGLFSILFVDTWTQGPGSTTGSLRS